MYTKPNSTIGIRHSAFFLLHSALVVAVIALFTTAPCAPAQDGAVTITAADFQRMVYSAHLLSKITEKPELDAGLQVLLELQRRNPDAPPAALADLLRTTTARYRTNGPAYLRTNAYRDEILAAYLDEFVQVPARHNFVSGDLALLNHLMLSPQERANYITLTTYELINSTDQRLVASEEERNKRLTCSTIASAALVRTPLSLKPWTACCPRKFCSRLPIVPPRSSAAPIPLCIAIRR